MASDARSKASVHCSSSCTRVVVMALPCRAQSGMLRVAAEVAQGARRGGGGGRGGEDAGKEEEDEEEEEEKKDATEAEGVWRRSWWRR